MYYLYEIRSLDETQVKKSIEIAIRQTAVAREAEDVR